MVLTDRQRTDLHAGIYEYLLTQEGERWQKVAVALRAADPNCDRPSSAMTMGSAVGMEDDDRSVSSRISTSSRFSTRSGFSTASAARSGPTCKLEKKWTAVPRLQKKVLELERALASNAKIYAHRAGGAGGAMVPTGAVERRMLPRPPCTHTLKGHSGVVSAVVVHPVFTVAVSGSEDGTIKVWDHESGEYVRTLKGHTNTVHSLSFTPTGSHLASASSDLSIKLWDFSTYTCVRTLRGHDHTISAISFIPSPQSALVSNASSSNNENNNNNTSSGIDSTIAGAMFMVSASRDQTVKFWDLDTGFCDHTLSDHSDWVRCLAVRSNDGQLLATAGNDQTIFVYNIANGRKKISQLNGHEHVIESVAFITAPTPAALAESSSKDKAALGRRKKLTGAAAADATNEESRVNYLVSGGRDRSVRLWNALTSQCISVFKYHENWVRSVLLHPSGKFVISAGDDRTIRVMDIKTNRCIRTIADAHPHFVSSMSMHHTLPILISGGVDQTVKCWSLD